MKELVRFLLCFMCVKLIISKPQKETHYHFDLDPVNDLQSGYQLKDPSKRTLGYHRHYALGKHVKIHPSGYKYVLGYSPINVKYVPVIKPITVLRPVLQNSIKPSWKPIMPPSRFYLPQPQPVLHISKPVHDIDNDWKPVKPLPEPVVEQSIPLPIEQHQPVIPAVPRPVPAPVVPAIPFNPELHNYLFFQTPIAKPIILPHQGLLHVGRPQLPVLPLGASFPAPVLQAGRESILRLPHSAHHAVAASHSSVVNQIPAIPSVPVQPSPAFPPFHIDHPVAAPLPNPSLVQHHPVGVNPQLYPPITHLHPQHGPPAAHFHPQTGPLITHLHPQPGPLITHLHPQHGSPVAHLHPQNGPLITHLHPQHGLPIAHLHPQTGPLITHLHPQPSPLITHLHPQHGSPVGHLHHQTGPLITHLHPQPGPLITHLHPQHGPPVANLHSQTGRLITHLHPQPSPLITHLHPQPASPITHLHFLPNATPFSVEFHGNPHYVPIQKIPVQTPIIGRQPHLQENQPFNPDAAVHPGETDLHVPEYLPEHPNFRHYLQPQTPLFHNDNIVRPFGTLEPPIIHEHD